ncbi:potassium voltage-gated channel subfamily H member 8 isoform X1 [Cotesia glomerata]|uniref:potassium voltage-gated channel subfamily H member 8 isoform X1 n=1 Tax=Cotesia glomerata TaxID=32391 RepID=UPI001D01CE8E|nr:potassium voltage-gated channel subfamily H member 8 isoform X1 [Cotesia glomerata]XP_044592118.1 potassium voltage-gated channel subfamily H member 8 isoform X1 [Cotesia glomerata]
MPARKGLLAPQNTFLDTIATRFDGTHSNFVLGNAQVPSIYPIVYCSDGFCELTGYQRAQIMQKGCACKFLYGPKTTDEDKAEIYRSLEEKKEIKRTVIFYKQNTTPFKCILDIVPIKNEKGDVVLFLASHKDISNEKELLRESGDGDDLNGDIDPEAPSPNYGGRRRSRGILYTLSGHYNQDGKHKLHNKPLLHSPSATPLPEYKTSAAEKSSFTVRHYGSFRTTWEWITLVATIYVAVVVPYNASFVSTERSTVVSDVIVEAIFIVDILLNFRTTYVSKKGNVVLSGGKIAINYLKRWFLIDLLAALPFDLLYAFDVYSGEESGHSHIHLVKLTRLLRLARLFQKMERYSQYSGVILALLMLAFSVVAHWLACIWYVIAESEGRHNDKEWNLSWLHSLADRLKIPVQNVTRTESYVTALYFTCSSLTSVGFGNVSANTTYEKIFSIIAMLIGALMHAVVFGNMTAIIQRVYSRRSLYRTKWRNLKDFLTLHQIPDQLKQRMQDYFQTTWSLNHGIDIHETLREFPEELRGDVSMHLHREILSLPIFEAASLGCRKLLSLHIKSNFCAPEEYLVRRGDALSYIYYLTNGSMEVEQNKMVVAILGKGDLVGCDIDVHLQHGTNGGGGGSGGAVDVIVKSSCDVKALTYCYLKCIHIQGLIDVLRLYPEYQHQFAREIIHDLTHNLREGYEVEQESDMNGVPSLTLPSISEDDENVPEDGETSPLSPANRSPMHITSPRHKFRSDRVGRLVRGGLRNRVQVVTQESLEDHNRDANERLEATQVSTMHEDVITLSDELRNAIKALQLMVRTPRSNPSLPTPTGHSSSEDRLLAKSSSYLPDELSWGPPTRLMDASTQTDDNYSAPNLQSHEEWVKNNPQKVLVILGLDPELIGTSQGVSEQEYHHSTNSSPSSLPPPPYEPLPLFHGGSTPQLQECSRFQTGDKLDYTLSEKNSSSSSSSVSQRSAPSQAYRAINEIPHRFSAGDVESRARHRTMQPKNTDTISKSCWMNHDPNQS